MRPFTVACLAALTLVTAPARSGEAEAPKPAAAPAWVDIMPLLAESGPVKISKVADGVQMTQDGDQGRYGTRVKLKPPFKLECVARTDSTNIRLFYARGHFILNWEMNQNYLHAGSLATGRDIPDKRNAGKISPNEWHRFVWTINADGQSLAVDDKPVFEHKEELSKTEGAVAIGPAWKSVVILKSLRILTEDASNQKALAEAAKQKPEDQKPGEKKPAENPEEKKPEGKKPEEKPSEDPDF